MNNVQQHIIPKSYLQAWCDKNIPDKYEPYIWVFNNKTHDTKKKPPSSNFLCENNFYTVLKDDGARDLSIEHEFGRIEGAFVKIRDNKLLQHKTLSFEERFQVCLFVAALHSRTKKSTNNMSNILQPMLAQLEKMIESKQQLSSNEVVLISNNSKETIPIETLEDIVANPIQHLMPTFIDTVSKSLLEFELAVFYTEKDKVFITTDNPCVWFDSQAHTRHPMYQSVGLKYESTEIILPISPTHCIVLKRKGINGYVNIDTNPPSVDIINTLLYENSDEHYYSNSKEEILFLDS